MPPEHGVLSVRPFTVRRLGAKEAAVTGGEIVREARARHGMSQRVLAERAGTTQSAIARLEAGRVAVSFAQVERLVEICGLALRIDLCLPDEVVDRIVGGEVVDLWF